MLTPTYSTHLNPLPFEDNPTMPFTPRGQVSFFFHARLDQACYLTFQGNVAALDSYLALHETLTTHFSHPHLEENLATFKLSLSFNLLANFRVYSSTTSRTLITLANLPHTPLKLPLSSIQTIHNT